MFIIIKSRYCFVLGDVAKKTFENIRKRFNKARNEMIKAKKSGTSTQEEMEAAGDVDGYEYLMWLVPFIAVRKTRSNITSINSSTENEPLSKASDLEDELEDDKDEGNAAEELNLPKKDLEISSELGETRTSPETSSKNSQVTGRHKWKKGKRKEPETTAKELEKKELEFMSAVTEMVEQTNATDPDNAFANLVLSHVRQLHKRLKSSSQNEINRVLFRYMMYSESNSSQLFGITPDQLLPAQHVTQNTETQDLGHFTNLY